jgi:hypothetical protein
MVGIKNLNPGYKDQKPWKQLLIFMLFLFDVPLDSYINNWCLRQFKKNYETEFDDYCNAVYIMRIKHI